MQRLLLCFATVLLLMPSGCRKRSAQLPSNRPTVDTTALNLMQANQRIADLADAELSHFVAQSGLPFVHDEHGFWLLVNDRTEGRLIAEDDELEVSYQVSLLDSTLCENTQLHARIGAKQLPTAVEEALKLMHRRERATLLAPWYLMYGREGHGHVPPYTQVLIHLAVE